MSKAIENAKQRARAAEAALLERTAFLRAAVGKLPNPARHLAGIKNAEAAMATGRAAAENLAAMAIRAGETPGAIAHFERLAAFLEEMAGRIDDELLAPFRARAERGSYVAKGKG